jgi:hypothetical protein
LLTYLPKDKLDLINILTNGQDRRLLRNTEVCIKKYGEIIQVYDLGHFIVGAPLGPSFYTVVVLRNFKLMRDQQEVKRENMLHISSECSTYDRDTELIRVVRKGIHLSAPTSISHL